MLELRAEKREVFGRKLASERASGRLPAVVYGQGASLPLFVSANDFQRVYQAAGSSSLLTLRVGGGAKDETRIVLIHEVARDPLSSAPIHADFYAVDQNEPVELEIPINFIGVAPAVKELGGTLVKVLRALTISALPADLPSEIKVSVESLATLDSQIVVREIVPPPRVAIINKPDEVVAAISAVEEEKEESAPVDLSKIEVEKKGKKEEEAIEGASPTVSEAAKK